MNREVGWENALGLKHAPIGKGKKQRKWIPTLPNAFPPWEYTE